MSDSFSSMLEKLNDIQWDIITEGFINTNGTVSGNILPMTWLPWLYKITQCLLQFEIRT